MIAQPTPEYEKIFSFVRNKYQSNISNRPITAASIANVNIAAGSSGIPFSELSQATPSNQARSRESESGLDALAGVALH